MTGGVVQMFMELLLEDTLISVIECNVVQFMRAMATV
jgi:hypothetical protein